MGFPETRWTLIRQAVEQPDEKARVAWESLCRQYLEPVQEYIRGRVSGPELAEDLCQDFFAQLVEGSLLERADPSVGRFRSFLLHAVRCFLADAADRRRAQKRGGGIAPVSLDDAADPEDRADPADREFERLWARTVLLQALSQLRQEYLDHGRSSQFEILSPALDGQGTLSGDEQAAALKMSPAAARVALHRMRKRLGELIRLRVADTVPSTADVDDELMRLRSAFAEQER